MIFGILIVKDFELRDGEVAASEGASFVEDNIFGGVQIIEIVTSLDEDTIFAGGANTSEIRKRNGNCDGARARNDEEGKTAIKCVDEGEMENEW